MNEIIKTGITILGAKPVAEAMNTVVKGTVDGLAEVLKRICLPALEEYGELLRDNVKSWRKSNMIAMAKIAEQILNKSKVPSSHKAHPKIAIKIIEESSWADDDYIQSLWAGLLVSSCTESGVDDGNIIFINLLSQITSSEARILKHVTKKSIKQLSSEGIIECGRLRLTADQIMNCSGCSDISRIYRELNHLRSLGLITGGFGAYFDSPDAEIGPTTIALQLYVLGEGYSGSTADFFSLKKEEGEGSCEKSHCAVTL